MDQAESLKFSGMEQFVAFARKSTDSRLPDDPLHLYRMLAVTNRGPEAVWGHQQDVLRSWHHEKPDASDVAIELPTGAGKTLVGGLIAEFRRLTSRERVAYLCPTRQLAQQTSAAFSDYGIPNALLIDRVTTWNPADRARYEAAEAVAVSVYSHVFNSNPALANANLLVLDDAHAAEGYVASPWRLTVSRQDESAYQDLLSALEPALDPLVVPRLKRVDPDSTYWSYVYLASPIGTAALAAQLEEVIGSAISGGKLGAGRAKSAQHVWKFLQGHLDRSLFYVAHRQIVIRPFIPPTTQLAAFSDPERRIYMSATLGAGGELERAFGRRKIDRIPVPDGWEKQGTGRRFFIFPELATDLAAAPAQLPAFVSRVISEAGRAIVLTPDSRSHDSFIDSMLPDGYPVLEADGVEENLSSFTAQPRAALVLTNRYDGIDLPNGNCRLVILNGLPARGDLQERFLHESLGAVEVLQERIRARILQGSGRATRNTRDFAAVMILGQSLTSYLSGRDIQAAMHPEVHAELEFGWDNSRRYDSENMIQNLRVFLRHDEEWAEVDGDIVREREKYARTMAPSTRELQRAVKHEVEAWQAIWNNQWDWALTAVRQVLDQLKGERTPRRYAAFWSYLGFSVAQRLAQQTGDQTYLTASADYFRDAQRMSTGTMWLSHLASPSDKAIAPPTPQLDELDEAAMRCIRAQESGVGDAIEQIASSTRSGLVGTEFRAYEAALVSLGKLAGASESYGNDGDEDPAAPDAVWIFNDARWVTWEAKSEAQPKGAVGPNDVRQAGSHLRTVETERAISAPSDSVSMLMSPKPAVMPEARALAEEHLYLVGPQTVLVVLDRLLRAWRTARGRTISSLAPVELAEVFRVERALPSQWLPLLREAPIRQQWEQ
ncbi:DEAD/DEAH box helicase [Streptomyces sp. So13.3]|uniref:DEAD/DEAH box helicase n=1 Tax=unclassified Streptomyces TaxID=2593676 RepID=UPI001105C196|nr:MULTISPECIES: DEAD/DEAH box helicase [unclassified Streptomyces]NEA72611.1 DEAD/DEAH box helicase [Streptomyces sp. SID13588]QNA73097.1 DEAD/DEAH box helicase [Streptomyces sp. So13.3]